MEYLKYILYSFIVLAFSSCEYNLLRFGWTDYSVDQRFEDSRNYNEQHPAQNLSIDSDEYFFTATSDYHLHTDSVFLPTFFNYINNLMLLLLSFGYLELFQELKLKYKAHQIYQN